MTSIHRARPWVACILAAAALAACTFAHAASTGQTSLLRVTGSQGGTGFGDYVSDDDALDTEYRFFVEVPPNTSSLQIDFYDADVGAEGANDDTENRDRLRTAFNTRTEYRLFNPGGTQVATVFSEGTATLPAGGNEAWLNFFTTANPAAGHWRVEVDSSTAETTGDDVNAFGLRAHDGSPTTSAGTELNVYADNLIQIGINPVAPGERTSLFALYPYVTHGCSVETSDFDYDDSNSTGAGATVQAENFANRSASFNATFATGVLSNNDVWNTELMAEPTTYPGGGPSGNQESRDGYGLWPSTWRINEVDGENANFTTLFIGPEQTDATPPAANPEALAFRIYFPTDAGVAPVQPYLVQYYQHISGPNPPNSGQTSVLQVTVVMVNPTPRTIAFSSTNTITTRVGGPTAVANENAAAVFVGGSATVDQGSLTLPLLTDGSTGLLTWNPGNVLGGTNAILSYRIRVTPPNNDSGLNRRFTGQGNSTANDTNHGTRARFVDHTGNTTQAQATYTIDGLCGLAYREDVDAPVPVTVSSVAATRSGGSVHVEWTTSTETRNGGFDVYGLRADGSWLRLTTAPVLSKAADGVEEQVYAATVAAPADVDRIAIEDIALDGERKRHDAVAIGTTSGARAGARIDWSAIEGALPARSAAGSGPVYLDVQQRGIHRISVASLAAAGQDLSTIPPAALALRDADGPVPLRIIGAEVTKIGPNAVLEFLGEPRESLYGNANRYTLSSDPAAALRPSVSALDPAQARRERDSWRGDAMRENQAAYSLGALTDDPWFDTLLAANAGVPASWSFAIDVPAAVALDGATVALELEGETAWPQANDHRLDIAVNGTAVGRHEFDGRTIGRVRLPIPDGVLQAGTNQVSVSLPADQGVLFDRMRLQSVSIRYDRGFVAEQGRLVADLGESGDTVPAADSGLMRDGFDDAPEGCDASGCTLLRVAGISGDAIAWHRDGNGAVTLLFGLPGAGGYELVVPQPTGELFVAQESSALAPAIVAGAASVADVPAGTDFVVIAHPAFAGSLGSFVTAREAEGLDVVVATTDSIYARYSAGLVDPVALRAYIRDSHAHGARYALLVGGDTYDYENRLGSGAISFVPTLYTWTDNDVRYAPSDALLGDVDGDGLPEVAIGRWPVRTTAELDAVVAKTLAYASAAHAGKAVFAADNPEEVEFDELSGFVASAMTANGWTVDRVDVVTSNAAPEHAALVAAINQGRALTHFVGHSGVDRWTFESLLLAGQVVPELTNAAQPTIVAQWGCWSSYFVSPFANSIAHQFLFDTDGGAAAVIGAGTRIRNGDQDEALRAFMLGISTGSERIGDAIDAMRRNTSRDRRDLVYGVNLLGDPTLKLRR